MANDIYKYFSDCVEDIQDRVPSDWEYTAYHNDAAPSYQANGWHIWVLHSKPAKRDREFADDARFNVMPINQHGEYIEGAESYDFDDFSDVLEFVKHGHDLAEQEEDEYTFFCVRWEVGYENLPENERKKIHSLEEFKDNDIWNLDSDFIQSLREAEYQDIVTYQGALGLEKVTFEKITR